ncbi:MAG: phage integrase N-terminal SAM-like domain-containing protein [Candidatus Marinimicrobia bacterium]|nr:phage integrase N-terminal SAM-like domain-containing protein [Candidatus Neomarinimicrobiota bacterium]
MTKILDQVSDKIRLRHYSYRTEKTYIDWVKRFIKYHDLKHPSEMGAHCFQVGCPGTI